MKNDIGIIGLAVMGRSLALNMADHGFLVAGFNRSSKVTEDMMEKYPHEGVTPYYDIKDMVASLKKPRKIMIMVKAGKPVDAVIEQLIPLLEEDDIIMDGGNSFFEDTIRRTAYVLEHHMHYFGVGVSGGEEGARFGPSIMPGGNKAAYEEIRPILESIAAKAEDGAPCCTYIGENGAGHYVKMVHNGIEYADMQLISEAYLQLKYIGKFSNKEIGKIFHTWNQGELNSFLIRITADIFHEVDVQSNQELLDVIVDSAGQKGTGRWTSIEALKQGVETSMITASCNARVMSNQVERRNHMNQLLKRPKPLQMQDKEAFVEQVREGLFAAKIIAYAQGFELLQDASNAYGWNLPLGNIASIFRAGCIIQAQFLNDITKAYQRNENIQHLLEDAYFMEQINKNVASLRQVVSHAVCSGIPAPSLGNAISYIDMFSAKLVGANLIQAQRDYFGAHTFERIDAQGSFHHEWGKTYES